MLMVLGIKNCFPLNPLIIGKFAALNVNNRAPGLLLPARVGLKCSLLVAGQFCSPTGVIMLQLGEAYCASA